MKRAELITSLDDYLRVKEIEDISQNGLQLEGPQEVTKIVFAVDTGDNFPGHPYRDVTERYRNLLE